MTPDFISVNRLTWQGQRAYTSPMDSTSNLPDRAEADLSSPDSRPGTLSNRQAARRTDIPVEALRRLLDYDQLTGVLRWRERADGQCKSARAAKAFNTKYANRAAGALSADGYINIPFGNAKLRAHRAAWAIHNGEWPSGDIDHINGDRADNRISNLRDVTASDNQRNAAKRRDNRSGHSGVFWDKRYNLWIAQIRINRNEQCFIGSFRRLADAVVARRRAEIDFGYHGNHGLTQAERLSNA